jgi:hypothetical protein
LTARTAPSQHCQPSRGIDHWQAAMQIGCMACNKGLIGLC